MIFSSTCQQKTDIKSMESGDRKKGDGEKEEKRGAISKWKEMERQGVEGGDPKRLKDIFRKKVTA